MLGALILCIIHDVTLTVCCVGVFVRSWPPPLGEWCAAGAVLAICFYPEGPMLYRLARARR